MRPFGNTTPSFYARPGAMHSAFNQFAVFSPDAIDDKAFMAIGKLTIPVLAIVGGTDHSEQPWSTNWRFVSAEVTLQKGVNRNVDGRTVRRVLGYNGNGAHFRRTTDEVAKGGYQEFTFR
jgi:hypothetical protein